MLPIHTLTFLFLLSPSFGEVLELKLGQELSTANFGDYNAEEVSELKVEPKDILDATSIKFPTGDTMERKFEPIEDSGYSTIEFSAANKEHLPVAECEADITVNLNGPDVTGQVMASDGRVYLIVHLEGANHAWIKTWPRNSSFSDGASQDENRVISPEENALIAMGRQDQDTLTTISVKIYYTKDYLQRTSNLMGEIEHVIGTTNTGYQQSNVKIKVHLHCTELYTGSFSYSKTGAQNLEVFKNHKGGGVKSVLGSADTAILLTTGRMGDGYDGWARIKDTSLPLGIVNMHYKTGFLFGHEFSHIIGCNHDDETLNQYGGAQLSYNYAKGFRIPGTKKYTIMAYSSYGNPEAINYYSGPNVYDSDGTRTGDGQHDNARVLNDMRMAFAAIGNESEACPRDPNAGNGNNNNNNNNTPSQPPTSPPTPPAPPKPQVSSCKDQTTRCRDWPQRYCKEYPDYMKQYCANFCGLC